MTRIHPTTQELAATFMRSVPPTPPGDPSEDVYFDTMLTNAEKLAKTDPSVQHLLGIILLLAGPAHDQFYGWLDRQRAARKPGERGW